MVNDSRTPSRSRRILFSFRGLWYLKFYESVLRRLAERGHTVRVLVDHGEGNPKVASRTRVMESLTREYPSITFGWAPRRVADPYVDLCIWIRRAVGYLHFLSLYHSAATVGLNTSALIEAGILGRPARFVP
jgi:hypothetical protein